MFPTSKDPDVAEHQRQLQMQTEATGEAPEQAAAARKEMLLLTGAAFATLLGISLLMVLPPPPSLSLLWVMSDDE